MNKIMVETNEKMRIDKYLAENTEYSRSTIEKMLDQHLILLNQKEAKPSTKVKENDEILIQKELEEEIDLTPEKISLDIVFEDENVILINKPSGMVVHPGSGNFHGTMVNALLYHTQNLSDYNGSFRPGIVHRIDKDTSGLILVAKNNLAHERLSADFKEKKIQRTYLALVKGVLPHHYITIDAPIGRDEKNRKRMAVTDKNSKSAVTHVEVLKRYAQYTFVKCQLETGRTHQIRVHLAHIGYPVFNDPVYGKEVIPGFGQFLHSYEISFIEPITKEALSFKVPLPKEFQDFLDHLEKDFKDEKEKND